MLKTLLLAIFLVPALAVSYYFVVALPAHNRAALEMEKQKNAFEIQKYQEQKLKEQKIAENAQEMDRIRLSNLKFCIHEANSVFDEDIKRNGTRSKNGGYEVAVTVADGIQRRKEAATVECHRQYDK